MAKYTVKAYPRAEYGLKGQETTIIAKSHEEAEKKAFEMFDEYDEIGVWPEESEEKEGV